MKVDLKKSDTLALAAGKDPVEAAEMAHLSYIDDETPGITRLRRGRGFVYFDPQGDRLSDPQLLGRIRTLAIPPAWEKVWICLLPHGHIQATGRDGRGRKQYIYHPRWQELRSQTKFFRLALFGRLLPSMRAQVDKDLSRPGFPKVRAQAFVVRLLDITLQRIGNPQYVRMNRSYGLSTLRADHVEISGSHLRFSFPGKRRVHQNVEVHDRRLAKLAKKYQELPGQELVRYHNAGGQYAAIDSADVNAYLMKISGENFSAKDFRTWGATVVTAAELYRLGSSGSSEGDLRNVTRAIRKAASRLGNTLAICRKYYVHPAVVEIYRRGELPRYREKASGLRSKTLQGLSEEEKATLLILTSGDAEL
jgi:DNA topoisomerase-1